MAPATGLEPVTYWLTANRSTTELRRNTCRIIPVCLEVVKLAAEILFLLAQCVYRFDQFRSGFGAL